MSTEQSGGAVVAQQQPSAIVAIRERFLAPAKLLADLGPHLDMLPGMHPLSTEDAEAIRRNTEVARRWRTELPAWSKIRTACELFREAVHKPADLKEATFIIATMLDAYPVARVGSFQTYVDAMLWASEDEDGNLPFSSVVIALAARDCVRTCKFTPTAAEMIGFATEHRRKFYEAIERAERLRDMRYSAEFILESLHEETDHPDDIEAMNSMPNDLDDSMP